MPGRHGQPHDIAEQRVSLGGDETAYVTIQDGGRRVDVERHCQRWVFEIDGGRAELVAVYDADWRLVHDRLKSE